MPALVVFESEFTEELAKSLVETFGYQQSMEGFSPSEGTLGTTHWPMLSDLPANVLYHPERNATESYREVASFAEFNGYRLARAVAFNVDPKWHAMRSRYDDDKPGIQWEDLPKS